MMFSLFVPATKCVDQAPAAAEMIPTGATVAQNGRSKKPDCDVSRGYRDISSPGACLLRGNARLGAKAGMS
jgi:hypothetical protein